MRDSQAEHVGAWAFAKTSLTAYATRAMSSTTHARGAALARACRLLLAAQRHRQATIDVAELALALEAVDVEGLAEPRPAPVGGLGDRPIATCRAASIVGEKVAWS